MFHKIVKKVSGRRPYESQDAYYLTFFVRDLPVPLNIIFLCDFNHKCSICFVINIHLCW